MSSALIIAAARQDALEAALRDAGCIDVETAPLADALALLVHERRTLVVADIVEAEDADNLAQLADRLRGTPLTLEARMQTQSILYRTLWLFAITFVVVAIVFAAVIWWVLQRGKTSTYVVGES